MPEYIVNPLSRSKPRTISHAVGYSLVTENSISNLDPILASAGSYRVHSSINHVKTQPDNWDKSKPQNAPNGIRTVDHDRSIHQMDSSSSEQEGFKFSSPNSSRIYNETTSYSSPPVYRSPPINIHDLSNAYNLKEASYGATEDRHTSPNIMDSNYNHLSKESTHDPLSQSLFDKLLQDRLKSSKQKALELQIREELRRQQQTLESTIKQSEKDNLVSKGEFNKILESAVEENNKKWESILKEKLNTIDRLTAQLDDVKNNHMQNEISIKRHYESRIKELTDEYDIKLYEFDQKMKADRESQAISFRIDQQAKEFEITNRYETKEEALKEMFDKKIRKFERQMVDTEQTYKSKLGNAESHLQALKDEFQVLWSYL